MNTNIFTFYGADEKVGTTMITQMIADRLADKYPDKKVLYLHLSGTKGTDYTNQIFVFCLDDIKPKLVSGVFEGSEFASCCEKNENLYTLEGCRSYLERKDYTPEDVKMLLKKVSIMYDIVIVDAGGDVDNGIVFGALEATKNRIIVMNQLRKATSTYKCVNDQVLSKTDFRFTGMILNKFVAHPDLPDDLTIESQMNIPLMGVVPYSQNGIFAEMEKKTLSAYKEKSVHEALKQICNKIETTAGFSDEAEGEKKRGFKLFRRGGE